MKILLTSIMVAASMIAFSQSADEIYHSSAKLYIGEKNKDAKRMLDEGILQYPTDRKLRELRALIKEEEKKNQEQQDQEKQDQENQDQENKDQQKKEQEKKDQDKEDQKSDEEKKKEQEQKQQQ